MKPENKRRSFLLGATVGSAGAVAAVVAGGHVLPLAEVAKAAEAKPKGYHETDHIRQYYDTTRI
ncbi:MAG: formate dehydrogenase [Betaproteobacteria bacterium]|nr:formate dehydrogenase [Betaproteobacteria bacterium]